MGRLIWNAGQAGPCADAGRRQGRCGWNYPTTNLFVFFKNFAGSGRSSRQVMFVGRLPTWLAQRWPAGEFSAVVALALPMEQILGDGLVNDIQSSLTNIDFIIQLYSFIRQERFALGCGTLRKFARQIGARSHKRGNQGIGLISKLLVQRLWTIWQLNIYGVFYIFLFSWPRCITALQVSNPDSKEFSCVCAQNVLNLNGCKLR